MTCKVCGLSSHGVFCGTHDYQWIMSMENKRVDCFYAEAAMREDMLNLRHETALTDFITRVRLERLNGAKA